MKYEFTVNEDKNCKILISTCIDGADHSGDDDDGGGGGISAPIKRNT